MSALVTVHQHKGEWFEARRAGIGSSDAATILGISRFGSPLSLYYRKKAAEPASPRSLEILEWGLALEEPMARRFEADTHRKVFDPEFLKSGPRAAPVPFSDVFVKSRGFVLCRMQDNDRLVASPDRLQVPNDDVAIGEVVVSLGTPGLLELKNVHEYMADEWEGEPPVEYQVQAQHQMMVTGHEWASIAGLIGGNRFVYADIRRDDEFIAKLREAEEEFLWRIDNDQPPPVDGTEATREVLRKLYPKDTGEVIDLSPALALDWAVEYREVKKLKAQIKDRERAIQNQITAAIGHATVGQLPDGTSFSWKWQKTRAHQVAESEYRVLRHHEAKK